LAVRFGHAAFATGTAKEIKMEKIAVSCDEPNLDAPVDARFGRAAGFVIVDPQTMAFEYVDNGASQVMARGAGIQAAEIVARAGAGVVLTGFVGPKAYQALTAAGIKIGQNLESLTVRQAVERYTAGAVQPATQPTRKGHGL
jgi:predicted Fe-Mo cluster-binding NifX family protein